MLITQKLKKQAGRGLCNDHSTVKLRQQASGDETHLRWAGGEGERGEEGEEELVLPVFPEGNQSSS